MKISLILPYWDRQAIADKALALLAKTYAGFEFEVVVVDDGNRIPFKAPDVDLNIKVVTLPLKDEPMCPSTAWNAGVAISSGDIIVLSCIEILHEMPVLQRMEEALRDLGDKGYVLASAWCPDLGSWHCHSSVKTPRNPAGTGIAFCGMMNRSLFDAAGGFDEEYRDGAGYEDNDFVNRVLQAGGRFLIRDDLVVIHPKDGASITWGSGKFDRNEKLYYDKWPVELSKPGITVACVNLGNYCGRGAEYVNTLFDMVRRNLSPNVECKFACLTDDAIGLHPDIRAVPVPGYIEGWYGKLYLFRDGIFPEGERVVYFDLDTLIAGPLEEIFAYDGDFATLTDFMVPSRVGPAVMLWKAGAKSVASEIWRRWEAAECPEYHFGDMAWINNLRGGDFAEKADRLQDLFEDRFVSYKMHAQHGAPLGSSVICFHGLPRPHEVGGWVADIWKIGGLKSSELEIVNNVNLSVIKRNIRTSSMRDVKWLEVLPETDRELLIVGGGPSLVNDLEEIRDRVGDGAAVMALNGATYFMDAHGIPVEYAVVIDARESNEKFVTSNIAGKYFIASQCDGKLFDALGDSATLFHIAIPDIWDYIPNERECQAVGGGASVGLIAMSLAYTQGYRHFHLYGYDSSYSSDAHHAYYQPENDDDPVLDAHVNGRTFRAAPWMVTQVNQFQELSKQLMQLGCTISVHGTGLLPTVAWAMTHQ